MMYNESFVAYPWPWIAAGLIAAVAILLALSWMLYLRARTAEKQCDRFVEMIGQTTREATASFRLLATTPKQRKPRTPDDEA